MKGSWLAVITLSGLWLAGCNNPSSGFAPVKGKVTVAGAPMAGITVGFTPASGRPASGVTDASGNFELSTYSKGDGAAPGKYKVFFSYAPPSITSEGGKPPSAPDYTKRPDPKAGTAQPGAPALPFNQKYRSVDTSGIEVEVTAGKTNEGGPWDLEK